METYEERRATKRAQEEAEHARCVHCLLKAQAHQTPNYGGHGPPWEWNETHNVCTGCQVAKPWGEFNRDAKGPLKRKRRCRTCMQRARYGQEPRATTKPFEPNTGRQRP